MKTLLANTVAASALALVAFPALADSHEAERQTYLPGVEQGVRASDFIGKTVYVTEADTTGMSTSAIADADAAWQNAGEINDLMISLSGDTEAVLVDVGGFLGIGEKTVAVALNEADAGARYRQPGRLLHRVPRHLCVAGGGTRLRPRTWCSRPPSPPPTLPRIRTDQGRTTDCGPCDAEPPSTSVTEPAGRSAAGRDGRSVDLGRG